MAPAGGAAAGNLESINSAVTSGFNGTVVPFVGQNLGANKQKRVNLSIIWGLILSASIAFAVSMTIYAFGESLLSIYLPKDQ